MEMNLGIGAMGAGKTVGRLTAPVCVREDGGPLPLRKRMVIALLGGKLSHL